MNLPRTFGIFLFLVAGIVFLFFAGTSLVHLAKHAIGIWEAIGGGLLAMSASAVIVGFAMPFLIAGTAKKN